MNNMQIYPMYIFLKEGLIHKKIILLEILFIRAARDYSIIYTRQGEHLSSYGISELEKLLDPTKFIRIHRSFIVNMIHVETLKKIDGKLFLNLLNGCPIPVGKTYMETIKKLIA